MTTPPAELALGLDIGGTSTRALVIGIDGARYGTGHGPGANLTSHALDHALNAVSAALDGALRDVDPAHVQAAVIGTAGPLNLSVPAVAEALAGRWRDAGLNCDYDVRDDAIIAFIAGTAASAGTLVLSGTGAIVARIEEREVVHVVDGHGWLLGDLGSGFWLGREAVRATLADLDRRVTPGPLGRAVLETLLGGVGTGVPPRSTVDELILDVHSRQPVALAELAPLVSRHADDDPDAERILQEAADHLLRATATVRPPGDTTPIVLAGSLLTSDTPLARMVRPRLAVRWPEADVAVASDPTAGSAWLAAVQAAGLDDAGASALHRKLFAS